MSERRWLDESVGPWQRLVLSDCLLFFPFSIGVDPRHSGTTPCVYEHMEVQDVLSKIPSTPKERFCYFLKTSNCFNWCARAHTHTHAWIFGRGFWWHWAQLFIPVLCSLTLGVLYAFPFLCSCPPTPTVNPDRKAVPVGFECDSAGKSVFFWRLKAATALEY